MMTTTVIIIESVAILILLGMCAYLGLHKHLSSEMLESKDKMILYFKEQLNEKDAFILSRLQKIQESIKKE